MEKVKAVIDEPNRQGVMVLLGPSVDVRGIFVHVAALDEQTRHHDECQGDEMSE